MSATFTCRYEQNGYLQTKTINFTNYKNAEMLYFLVIYTRRNIQNMGTNYFNL